MSITKRQTKSGWVCDVRLRDAAGRVYTRTFRTKKEADRFESTEKADHARGVWIDPRLVPRTRSQTSLPNGWSRIQGRRARRSPGTNRS